MDFEDDADLDRMIELERDFLTETDNIAVLLEQAEQVTPRRSCVAVRLLQYAVIETSRLLAWLVGLQQTVLQR